MRIALIAPPSVAVPPPAYGGTEAVVDRLARGLSEAGHHVVLYATGDSTCPVERRWVVDDADGVRIGDAVAEVSHVVHAYRDAGEFDIVHDHTIVGPLYASRTDVRAVTTNHGPFDDELSEIYRHVGERVPIIAISRSQASMAGDIPVAAVIHHGLDPERFPVGTATAVTSCSSVGWRPARASAKPRSWRGGPASGS